MLAIFNNRLLFPALLLSVSALAVAGCGQKVEPGNPFLPAGFSDTPIPDVDVSGYIYVKQQVPIKLASKHFGGGNAASGLPPEVETSAYFGVDRIVAVAGPSLDAFGGAVEFTSEGQAETASLLLQKLADVWSERSGKSLALVQGNGNWAQSLREAMAQSRRVALKDKYPEIWEVSRLLPERPPAPPVAAGFLRLEKSLLESLGTKADIGLGDVSQALGLMRVKDIAFAIYAEQPLQVPERPNESFIKEGEIGAVLVARSGYPGPVVSTMLNTVGGRLGLEKTTIGEVSVRYTRVQDLRIFVANKGNVIFLAVAPEKAQAEKLMLSALNK